MFRDNFDSPRTFRPGEKDSSPNLESDCKTSFPGLEKTKKPMKELEIPKHF